jgi:hypothetical protein
MLKMYVVCWPGLQLWGNSYPEHALGIPGNKYTSPEILQAFNQHCAEVSAGAQSALYMNSKGLQI